ncbi:MAG TPA: deaminase [Candidatus Saccharimonadales bacterium]|nr:deaminase [Candidatus Saccharimonadales bacterium]
MELKLDLTPEEQQKQEYYRDARTGGYYGKIWTSVGKCVFCDLREKYVVMEENGMVMTVALFAYIDGNVMIMPRRHVKSVKELTSEEWQTARKMMYVAKKMIRKIYGIKGIQYIVRDGGIEAQSTVSDHLHIHVIPFDAPDLSTWNYRKLKYTPLENATLFRGKARTMAKLAEKFEEKYAAEPEASADKKEVYLAAFKQTLASKKKSLAKKTAKVGAAIIAGDTVISMSNANLVGGPMEYQKEDGTWTSPPTVSHAEERCISQAAKQGLSLDGATMIVTLSPCMACSRQIVNSGIRELHYIDDWWDQEALGFLRENDVKVVKLPYKKGGKRT